MVVTTAAVTILMMVVLVMVLMVVTTAAVTILMMVVLVMMLMFHLFQILFHGRSTLHSLQELFSRQFGPGSGDQSGCFIVLAQKFYGPIQLCLCNGIGTGQNDGRCGFDLIVIELTKVLHINLNLTSICHSYLVAKAYIATCNLLHCCHHIGQLANTGRLDDHPVRMVFGDHFVQGFTKVAYQRTADTAGVHFGNVDACFLEETTVNADLTEFIFNEHQLLAAIGFLNHFFDQSRLTSAQKAGINIDNCHCSSPSVKLFEHIIPPFPMDDKWIFLP